MNARDALEAVRNRLLTAADDFDRLHDQEGWKPTADLLREAAQALVERAGEPVAYISQTALDALNKCRNDDHNGIVDIWMRPNDTLKATIPLYTAPGASHD